MTNSAFLFNMQHVLKSDERLRDVHATQSGGNDQMMDGRA